MPMRSLARTFGSLVAVAQFAGCAISGSSSATVSLDSTVVYQTMRGWEAALTSTVRDYQPFLPAYDSLFPQAANELGITRLRIALQAGTEHPPGYGIEYLEGRMSERVLVSEYANDIINDNDDPNVADTTKFDFTLLDWRMENMVLPYRRQVEASGQRLYSYVQYNDFRRGRFEHYADPAEYAEFMLVIFDHLKHKYDFVPDGVNVINEPDHSYGWAPGVIGHLVVAAGDRLAAAGYHPDFMAPATLDRGKAAPYFDAIMKVPGAARYLKELGYHCYADSGKNSRDAIAERTVKYGVSSVMNECWRKGNDYRALHADLAAGRNAAWQLGPFHGSNGYYRVDQSTFRVTLNPRTYPIRQYLKHIRPGARRIAATARPRAFAPLAFIGLDGKYVVVVKADRGGEIAIAKLPAGRYGVSYSTATELDGQLQDAVVSADQPLVTRIPATGVITIYGK